MPQQSIDAAKAAIAAAQNAKAGQYAQAELANAETALRSALEQQRTKNVFQAKSFAGAAKTQAEAALRIAQQRQTAAPTAAPGAQAPGATPPKPATTATPPPTPGSPKAKGGKK